MESPGDLGPTCPGGGPRAAGVTTTRSSAGLHSRIKHSLHLQHLETLLGFLGSSKARRPARSFLKVPDKRTKTPRQGHFAKQRVENSDK